MISLVKAMQIYGYLRIITNRSGASLATAFRGRREIPVAQG
jgi:hypothetical protein